MKISWLVSVAFLVSHSSYAIVGKKVRCASADRSIAFEQVVDYPASGIPDHGKVKTETQWKWNDHLLAEGAARFVKSPDAYKPFGKTEDSTGYSHTYVAKAELALDEAKRVAFLLCEQWSSKGPFPPSHR